MTLHKMLCSKPYYSQNRSCAPSKNNEVKLNIIVTVSFVSIMHLSNEECNI